MHKGQEAPAPVNEGESGDIQTENQNKIASESTASDLDSVLSESANDVPPHVSESATIPNAVPPADRTGGAALPGSGDAVAAPGKRGRGRPRKSGVDTPPNGAATSRPKLNGVTPPVNSADAAIEPCAEILVMMTNASGMMLAQGEAGAMSRDEAILAKHGYVAYLKAKGVENVPAWVILAGSLCPYYLRIITTTPAKTTVATGMRRAWFGIKEFFINRKAKKNAYSNSGDDIKRENNSSETISPQNV